MPRLVVVLLLLPFVVSARCRSDVGCPEGWFNYGTDLLPNDAGGGLHFTGLQKDGTIKCYKFFTWTDECRQRGGDFASVHSGAANDFFAEAALNYIWAQQNATSGDGSSFEVHKPAYLRLGGVASRTGDDGVAVESMMWTDGSLFDYANFAVSAPSDATSALVVQVNPLSTDTIPYGKWTDKWGHGNEVTLCQLTIRPAKTLIQYY